MVFLYRRNWRIRRILGIVLGLLVASSVFMAVLRTMQRPAAFPRYDSQQIYLKRKYTKVLRSPRSYRVSYMQGLSINLTSVVVSPSELHTLPSQVLLDMRNKSRLYKTIFERVHLSPQVKHYPKSIEYREARWLLDTLEDTLYPISRKKYPGGVKQLYDSFSGRGIVMTSGSKHFK